MTVTMTGEEYDRLRREQHRVGEWNLDLLKINEKLKEQLKQSDRDAHAQQSKYDELLRKFNELTAK